MTDTAPNNVHGYRRWIAHRLIFPAIEFLWCRLFSLAGILLRPQVSRLTPSGRDYVLVLAPHPDDETIGCGGAIALHALAGDQVTVCVVTDGGGSRAGGIPPDEMVARRRSEARAAMEQLGSIDLIQLGLPEGTWQNATLIETLVRLLQDRQPEIIYTTSPVDYHPDHIRVAHCLSTSLRQAPHVGEPAIRLYEVQVPLTPLLADTASYIADVAGLKSRALDEYRTQHSGLGWLRRLSKYQQRLYRAGGPVELFNEQTLTQFIAFISTEQGRATSYRGIRLRPFTDPAAWLVGTRSRLRLRRFLASCKTSEQA
jgi:LmbE family N-acetylglucosaminyl deacetylase